MRSTAEVASVLGVSTRTIQNMVARGELRGVRVGRQWRIHGEELDRLIRGDTPHAAAPAPHDAPTPSAAWLTVTEAAQLLLADVSGIDLGKAKARVSKAASENRFRTNSRRGHDRRIDRDSFSTWRLEQRERDLAAFD